MSKKLQKIMVSTLLALVFLLTPNPSTLTPTHAQAPTCTPLYGGGPNCEKHPDISIDKQVQDPQSRKFIENLTTVSNFLPANQMLTYRITVKNNTDNTLTDIAVTDILPSSLTFVKGNGKYDPKTRTFSDTIAELKKGATKMYSINVRVETANRNNTPACAVNQAVVTQGGKRGSDYVQFCINTSTTTPQRDTPSGASPTTQSTKKGGLAATQRTSPTPAQTKGGLPIYNQTPQSKTPQTGPELIGIIGIPPLAAIGYYLRRKTT